MKLSTAITLSCPQKNKAATCQVQALNSEIAQSIDHFSVEEWNALVSEHQSFLKHQYLKANQNHQSNNQYYYVLFHNETGPVGCAAFQVIHIHEGIRLSDAQNFNDRLLNVTKRYFNRQTFKVLICGNAMVTGDYGFHFDQRVPEKVQLASIVKTIDDLKAKSKVDMVLIKDFEESQTHSNLIPIFSQLGYTDLKAQPNMHLQLRPHWNALEDYMADMTSKARTRVKKNIKRGKQIFRKDLTLEEVKASNEQLYGFYRTVADRVEFNLSTAGTDYFVRCKENMGDDFRILAYYLEDRMVGFISLVLSESQVESHFIGFDESVNKPNALYPNILIDQIRFCIEETNTRSISFGRTALEIKSSFGAKPQDLLTVGWAKNPLYNRFIPNFFLNLAESEEWTQRNPFKNIEN